MKRHGDAGQLLNSLLDAWERRGAGGRRISARPPLQFDSAASRSRLYEALEAAADIGGITIEMDREAPHLVARVTLRDAEALYRHLGRQPAAETLVLALARLDAAPAETTEAQEIAALFAACWRDGRTAAGIGPKSVAEALDLVRAADAAFKRLGAAPLPLRSRSARLLGDSKALEKAVPKLISLLQQAGRIEPGLGRDEILKRYGLEKYAQPVLIAGPLACAGETLPAWPFMGVPPEAVADLSAPSATALLTIENLESFNRHVRERRRRDEVVVYLAGFPAPIILEAIHRVVESASLQHIWHWGDIDPGGGAIARHLELNISVPLRLHLMSAEIAERDGGTGGEQPARLLVPASSAVAALADYLTTPTARWLEQERIDPEPLPAKDDTTPGPASEKSLSS